MAAETPQPGQSPSVPLTHVDQYLAIAQAGGASDLHLGVHAPPVWRLHGTLRPIWPDALPLTAQDTAKLTESFLSDLPKPDTWFWERCTLATHRARSTGCSMFSWPINRNKSGSW